MKRRPGFTIVELLIVIVVIGILATLSLVSYNGITRQATEATLKSDLRNASTQLDIIKVQTGQYPIDDGSGLPRSDDVSLEYTSNGTAYQLSAYSISTGLSFHIDSTNGAIQDGVWSEHSSTGEGTGGVYSGLCDAEPYESSVGFLAVVESRPKANCHIMHGYFRHQSLTDEQAFHFMTTEILGGVVSNGGRTLELTWRTDRTPEGSIASGTHYGTLHVGLILQVLCLGSSNATSLTGASVGTVGTPSGYAYGVVKTWAVTCPAGRVPIVIGMTGHDPQGNDEHEGMRFGVVWGVDGI